MNVVMMVDKYAMYAIPGPCKMHTRVRACITCNTSSIVTPHTAVYYNVYCS